MTTPDQELLDTIEEIRKQKFPELPVDLVKQIVLIAGSSASKPSKSFGTTEDETMSESRLLSRVQDLSTSHRATPHACSSLTRSA